MGNVMSNGMGGDTDGGMDGGTDGGTIGGIFIGVVNVEFCLVVYKCVFFCLNVFCVQVCIGQLDQVSGVFWNAMVECL